MNVISPDAPPALDPLSDRVSYSVPTDPLGKRTLIRVIEMLTGQPKLQRLYDHYLATRNDGDVFWHSAVEYLRLNVEFDKSQLAGIPPEGPLIVLANHPFGVLDGIAIGHILSLVRQDFKLIAHAALGRAQVFRPYLIPIEFDGDSSALRSNVQSKRKAIEHLGQGGSLIIFPAGRVSTAQKTFGRATDDPWKMFPGRLVELSGAPVVPVYFAGQNGRLFHFVSKFSGTLREALIFREVAKRIGGHIEARIGEIISPEELGAFDDRRMLLDFIRKRIYDMSGEINLD